MTLLEALKTMQQAGFTQVKDNYSRFFKNIEEVLPEARLDLNDYTPNVRSGQIVRNPPSPDAKFQCS